MVSFGVFNPVPIAKLPVINTERLGRIMSTSYSRLDRVKKAMIREISDVIAQDVKEPALDNQIISITDIDLSRDFAVGKVYLSVMGSSANPQLVADTLQQSAHKIQAIVGRRLKLKNTTKFSFYLDNSLERGSRVHELLKQLSDERVEEDDNSIEPAESTSETTA